MEKFRCDCPNCVKFKTRYLYETFNGKKIVDGEICANFAERFDFPIYIAGIPFVGTFVILLYFVVRARKEVPNNE